MSDFNPITSPSTRVDSITSSTKLVDPGIREQVTWFDDLHRGNELPIRAPVSPNVERRLSLEERIGEILHPVFGG